MFWVLIGYPMESGFSLRTAKDAAMKQAPVFALGLSLALLTTSCGISAMQNPSPVRHVDVKDNQPPRPQIRRNPHPTAYEITMTIENAPGPFGSIEGFMQYDTGLDNPCMPDLGGMAGTRMRLSESIPVKYEKIGENKYRGIVYTDLLMDEDYYGLGVCHWSMIAARVDLRAGVTTGETTFFENIFHDDLVSKDRMKVYFWNGHYPKEAIDSLNVPGEDKIEKFKPEVRDDLFSLAFEIRKVTP
ncbi:MAG TPA: hypothetical protein VIT22_08285 [Pseudoxanthomonas sp.]